MKVHPNDLVVRPAEATNVESLPAEIKSLLLLNLPDPASLRVLVRASPSYHELYRSQRQLFLSTALFNCLSHTGLHVALTILEASSSLRETANCDGDDSNGDDEEEDLLHRKMRIRNRFFEQPSSIHMSRHWLDNINFDTLKSLLHYHWKIAAVVSSYVEETLSTNPVTGEPQSIPGHHLITRSETTRIYRAIYHFELYCLLFSSHKLSSSPNPSGRDTPEYGQRVSLNYVENEFSLLNFLPLLKSWEIEGIACIQTYIEKKYTNILQSCAKELQQLELGMGSHIFTTPHNIEYPDDISVPTVQDERKEYLISLGLTFFSAISISSSTSTQAALIFGNPWRRRSFLSRAISAYRELESRDQSTNSYNTTVLTFTSENEGPNAALPWSRFMDPEFFYRGREFMRGWGYVFWDRERLEGWKVLEKDPENWLGGMDVAPKILLNRFGRPFRAAP